ncbi:hypothetical protein E0H73_28710 [Kribbella pittospori]|uniref:Uncharacterized protein n=1 Tax=Kribbella pittospori TaxID=722689 RepID=A0A4R0KI25_9ACTN|nr:hypothetical protein [Kribbella pittospori]TCC58296.1 hypothetical protein E0H73_28710 [Kribbella pittospori]
MEPEDPRRRPVVLQSRSAEPASTRRPARYLAWAGTGLLGLAAAAGLVAGGTAVWTAFDPGTPNESPAQLWLPPPVTVNPQSATVTPTRTPSPDDHGGDRTRTPSATRTTERGDDKGGSRTTTTRGSNTTEPGDDKGGDSGNSGKGKSGSDDGSGHG